MTSKLPTIRRYQDPYKGKCGRLSVPDMERVFELNNMAINYNIRKGVLPYTQNGKKQNGPRMFDMKEVAQLIGIDRVIWSAVMDRTVSKEKAFQWVASVLEFGPYKCGVAPDGFSLLLYVQTVGGATGRQRMVQYILRRDAIAIEKSEKAKEVRHGQIEETKSASENTIDKTGGGEREDITTHATAVGETPPPVDAKQEDDDAYRFRRALEIAADSNVIDAPYADLDMKQHQARREEEVVIPGIDEV